jgi:SAM-dependent methyltransferase
MSARATDLGDDDVSFSQLFTHALRGVPCQVLGLDGGPTELPVGDWTRTADAADDALLQHCRGTTLDVGCGPGRLAARLAEVGTPVLGIDVVHEAVLQTRARGVEAIHASVHDPLPDEGTWGTALLADGNVGIGGDPVALLERLRGVLAPTGRVVVELAPPGVDTSTRWAWLEAGGARSRPFRWSVVGVDGILDLARETRFAVTTRTPFGAGRWLAVLERRA